MVTAATPWAPRRGQRAPSALATPSCRAGGWALLGGGGQGNAAFNPGNFASGEIKQVDGDTIRLSTATEVLTVKLNDQTEIQKTATGAVSDLQPGERITVQGERAADGTFTARSIQIGSGFGPGMGLGTPQAGSP